jgi:hypothetical protein
MPSLPNNGAPGSCRPPSNPSQTRTIEDVTIASTEAATLARDIGRLSDRDIACAVGASSGTVRAWMDGDTTPSRAQADRLTELRGVVERLACVINPSHIPAWLNQPLELLDGDKPIERIAAGDYRAVARLISGLEDPGAA